MFTPCVQCVLGLLTTFCFLLTLNRTVGMISCSWGPSPLSPYYTLANAFTRNRELPEDSESDRFQSDPLGFLKFTYGALGRPQDGIFSAPDLAVIYSTHLDRPGVAQYLGAIGLETAQVLFNAHVNGDADSDDTFRSVAVLERVFCQTAGLEDGGSCVS